MPIYEYRCEACDACFEKLVFSGDDEPVRCPACSSDRVQRQMSCVSAVGAKACKPSAGGFS
jgi:putative FmdB family regulatory protein